MAEMMNVGVEARSASSRIMPVFGSPPPAHSHIGLVEEQVTLDIAEAQGGRTGGHREERNPHDAWLPITESRKGNGLSAALHLLCSGIGVQDLMLPLAFVSLGWFWGIICLSLAFSWQLYTIWLLVNLHESVPPIGIRYSRYVHLSIVAFGEKLGKLLAIFPTMYLSGGACAMYIIGGGTTLKILYQNLLCRYDDKVEYSHCALETSTAVTGAEWFFIFICLAIFVALFFPNLNSLTRVSLVGSITAVAYCSILSLLSEGLGHDREAAAQTTEYLKKVGVEATSHGANFRDVMSAIGVIALGFRGHNLVLEIQGTMPTNEKQPSRKPMLRGVYTAYLLIALCLYPLAIIGYWAYGDKATLSGGIFLAYAKTYPKNHTSSKSALVVGICFIIIINYICAFQIYAMPTFDNLERIYITKKNGPCPRWVRSAIKVLFGGLTYFVAVAFPFLPSLGGFIGSIALPLTLAYPCFMWAAIKKPRRFSTMWCINLGLGSLGLVLCLIMATTSLWALIVNGIDANFFRPH